MMKTAETHEPAKAMPKLWVLRAKDVQEPPFHFTGVATSFLVSAMTEKAARHVAGEAAMPHGDVWMDADMTDCVEFAMSDMGVVARDLMV